MKILHPKDYEILSGQCEIFAKELLDQARSSEELSTILYYSDESDAISQDGILGKSKIMNRLVHAILFFPCYMWNIVEQPPYFHSFNSGLF